MDLHDLFLFQLADLNRPGLYALTNVLDKKVYIGYGKSMLKSVTRLLDDLKTNKNLSKLAGDSNSLVFSVIETCLDQNSMAYLRLRMGVHRSQYKDNGYSFYNSDKGLRLRVNSYLDLDGYIYVEVVSQSNKRIVVGVFKRVADADNFIKRHYQGTIGTIVYSDNRLTERYKQGLK